VGDVPLPPDEAKRLAALRALAILDTEDEERFDRITRVAARTFDAPIALVSLVDADRQWTKSRVGVTTKEVPRESSFCARAILGERDLVVPDTLVDPAFATNEQVVGEPYLRFYAGHVIRGAGGHKLGTVCVADTRPRSFGAEDRRLLGDLARWAEQELANAELGEALQARGETEQRLTAVMATVPDGVVSFNDEGIIESVNPAAERMFGLPEAFLVGERVDKLLHRLTWRELQGLVTQDSRSVLGQLIDLTGRRSDYSPFPLELTVGRTRLGRRTLFVGVGRDVTERKGAEQALERVRLQNELLLESAGEGIVGIDREGKVTFVNPAAAEILHRYAFEMVGQPLHDVIRMVVDGEVIAFERSHAFRTLADGQPRRDERALTRDDGTTFPAELTVAATRAEDDITGAVVTFRDVSERFAVDRMKDEFVSVVGHELRTPLTSIRGSLGLLAGGVLGELPEQAERMLQIAISNTDRLVRLINDILDLERIQSGKIELELEPQAARDLLEATVQVLAVSAAEHGVVLRVEAGDDELLGDHDRLVQALTNLTGNAIKFSEAGSQVVLGARAEGGEVLLEVRDEGRGIPAEHLDRIFDRFHQVDASDARELGGTGLGLAISRSIVDQHGGRIWAESVVGEGSTFAIALPVLRAQAGSARDHGERPAVLVTGGTDEARAALGTVLDRAGYRPTTVIDPGPFTAVLVAGDPADAVGALSALRARPQTAGVPLVFVGRQDEEELLEALANAVPALEPRRVLVVEDDPDLGRVLARMLERHGPRVTLARTGRQAIDAITEQPPDLLLLDLVLPESDGFAVVDHLRADPALASTPLVVYTAIDLDAAERERLQLGQTRFMTKGRSTPAEVEEHVKRLLESLA
jgi:PAS domain S-box-containing protein